MLVTSISIRGGARSRADGLAFELREIAALAREQLRTAGPTGPNSPLHTPQQTAAAKARNSLQSSGPFAGRGPKMQV